MNLGEQSQRARRLPGTEAFYLGNVAISHEAYSIQDGPGDQEVVAASVEVTPAVAKVFRVCNVHRDTCYEAVNNVELSSHDS